MKAVVAARSDVGQVREGNEDSYLVEDPLYAVADGMGGHLAGDVASQTAVETITSNAGGEPPQDGDGLAELVKRANAAIWEKASSDPSLRGMGTTCTLLMLDGSHAEIAHVGDSRAYLLRGDKLTQLTEDHTLVGRMVKEGRLKPEEAERHPQRSIITRALGVDSEVDVDLLSLDLQEGDRILICSDGLTSMIDADDIRDTLTNAGDAQATVDRLVDLANEAGGEDNITVVVIDIRDDAAPDLPAPAPARPEHETAATGTLRADTQPDASTRDPKPETMSERSQPGAVATAVQPQRPTAPAPARPSAEVQSRPPRVGRGILIALATIAVLLAAAYFVLSWVLSNSWYVGVNDDGNVTIFSGIPEDVGGFSFREEERTTDTALEDLPEFVRDDVENGIKVDSEDDAEAKVSDLQELASDREFEQGEERKKN